MQIGNLEFSISTVGDELRLKVSLTGGYSAVRTVTTPGELRRLADWINTMADKNTRKEAG